jgi:UDP-N-acetylglucosamine 4,6-dehydratase
MTRFWITLDEAVAFTLSCLPMMVGGEIFVPKIPSMKITDLIAALAPGMEQKIVGIRPGEKLHEIMITEHNASSTVDVGDRYVIEPEWSFWQRPMLADEGYPTMPEGFEYVSDKNDSWMTVEELKAVLETIPEDGQ